MILGIDGNQWYASCGGCLGSPRSHFEFADTPREAIEAYWAKDDNGYHHIGQHLRDHFDYLDMTVEDYKKTNSGWTPPND